MRRFTSPRQADNMQDGNPTFDPKDRKSSAARGCGGAWSRATAQVPILPGDSDAPTLIDFGKPSSNPEATVDSDATIIEGMLPPLPALPKRATRVPVAAPSLEIGDVLADRYEILALLGEGGMGAVYKAPDRELDRFVALKVIRPELASNPSILARFKQELLLAHQVTHRNVIRIYDLGEAEGVKFITMEFIEGKDLRALIREKKKFAPEEAVEIIQQVCQALDAAHSVGVIHRDLKPQNIMQRSAPAESW